MSKSSHSLFSRGSRGMSTSAVLIQAALGIATVLTLTGLTRLGKSHVRRGSPESAQKGMRALLSAKQARDRKGPGYPASNAHTGRPVDAEVNAEFDQSHQAPEPKRPSPDAIYGATFDHARGDQAKRNSNH